MLGIGWRFGLAAVALVVVLGDGSRMILEALQAVFCGA